MTTRILISATLGLLFLASCKKDSTNPPSGNSLPKTYTEDVRSTGFNSKVTYNLTYDGNNRLISMAAIPDPSITKFVYAYTGNSSIAMDLYNYNVLSIHEIMWLNSSSVLDSTFQFNDTQDTMTEKYIYNSGKQLVQIKSYDYSSLGSTLDNTTVYTYDNNGNVTKESDDNGKEITYTYTSIQNSLSMGQPFLPVPKTFINTATTSSGGSDIIATHFYSFDGNNRLVKDSSYTSGADVIAIKSYSY
jgi:hypothetical protein